MINRKNFLRLSLGLALTLVFAAGHSAEKPEFSKPRKSQLRHLLLQDCGSCHGMQLKGGLGPPLLPSALKQQSVEAITSTILYGRPGTAMPPWKGILSEAEADWLARLLLQGINGDE